MNGKVLITFLIGFIVITPSVFAAPYLSQYNANLKILDHFNSTADLTMTATGQTLTNTGSVTIAPYGKFLSSSALFSSSNHLTNTSTTYTPALSPGSSGDFTLLMWTNLSSYDGGISPFSLGSSSGTSGTLQIELSGNKINVCAADLGCQFASSWPITTNTLHQLVIRRTSGNISVYIDGVYNGSQAGDSTNYAASGFTIGRRGSYNYGVTGSIDELAYWNTSLNISDLWPQNYEVNDPMGFPPVADFSASPISVSIGSQTFFTDLSTNTPTEWSWDFGDGNFTGNTTADPSHLYTALGTYTVSLNATNAFGSNTTTKTNYITVANASAFARQDIMMDPAYTITFQAKDGNGAFITSTDTTFIITSSDGTETDLTTSTGRTNTTLGYDLYSVAAGAEGYTSASTTFVASSDRTITLTLATATSSSDVSNTLYSPKTIGITVVRRNPAGIHVAGAPISLVAIGSTLPVGTSESDSLQYIYGMNPTAANLMLNNTLLMSGTTGGDGSTGFTVLSTIGYTVTVTDPADSQVWTSTLYPSDPTGLYTIWIGANPIAEAANSTQAYLNQTRVWITEPDPANITFNLLYQDTSGDTSDVIFRVIASNNMTVIYQVDLGDPGTAAILANYTVPNIRGNAYYAGYNATRA